MEPRKQTKARNAEKPRTETLTFRLSKRLRSLAEVAARHKGVTLANYVETALEASLDEPIDFLRGASIAAVDEELYDEDEALCFLKRLKKYLWAMSPEQKRLLDLIHTSPAFYPSFRVYNTTLIKQHWPELSAVASGTADPTLLPPDLFDGIDVEFALMSEGERIALYQKDPEGCARRTQDYMQRSKRPTHPSPASIESSSLQSKPLEVKLGIAARLHREPERIRQQHPVQSLMGTPSITHPTRSKPAPLRIPLLLLLSLAALRVAPAQTSSISALTVPLILPSAVVFDATGNLYFAETGNHVIRKVDTAGNITTIAGTGVQGFSGDAGPATSATLDSPQGLALDNANNLYVADTHNHRIRKLNLTTGTITTIAGTTPGFSGDNAPATAAQLNLPTALAVDIAGNLYLADTGNHRVRKISTAGIITTIAGNGTQGFSGDNASATTAAIDSPTGLALDSKNNLYLADTHNHRIRKITAASGIITTIAGIGAPGFAGDTTPATSANLALPHGLTIDPAGNLYLADTANHRIRRIDATTGIITTTAGDGTQGFSGDGGPATSASFDTPRAATLSPSTLLTLADTGNQRIRQLTSPAPSSNIQTIAGLGLTTPGALTLAAPSVIAYGTGQLTATLASPTPATGNVTFFDTTPTTTTTLSTATLTSNIATISTAPLSAGTHNLTATYAGDQTHNSAQSSTLALTITPKQLSVTIAPITLVYGQPIPSISGTLTGVLPQDATNISATFTTTATSLSPAATYPITATLTGPAAGNYAIASPAATFTIAPAPTLITLSNLVANPVAGSPIMLTAHVASTTTATLSGFISLLDSGTPILTSPVSATGDAVFTVPSITSGSHTFTASYSGSTNFASSTSTPQLITVGTGPTTNPDFALAPTGTTTATIPSGSSASYTFAVQLQGPMSSPITLAATGLPNLATASFNPPTLPPGSTTNTFTLTITTPNTTAQKTSFNPSTVTWAFLLLPITAFTLRRRNYRPTAKLLTLTLLTLATLTVTGCGDRISTADALALTAKTYNITVTGTATTPTGGILQHSATVTLLVEQPQ